MSPGIKVSEKFKDEQVEISLMSDEVHQVSDMIN